ncbi:MAG TPA: lamin tail domain-containing protein [Patescibacteria group bacterium]
MRQTGLITFIVIILVLPLFCSRAFAADEPFLSLASQENFALPIDQIALPSAKAFSLKVCFSMVEENPPLADCGGQTWNGKEWLSPSAPWREFPTSNTAYAVTGRYIKEQPVGYLHIVGRESPDGTKSTVLATWRVEPRLNHHSVRLRAFKQTGEVIESGYVRVYGRSIFMVPLVEGWTSFSLPEEEATLEVLDAAGTIQAPAKNYIFLTPNASYTLVINAPPYQSYMPALIQPESVLSGSNITSYLRLARPYSGRVVWKRNGIVLAESGQELVWRETQSGVYDLEAVVEETGEYVRKSVAVMPVTQVKITQLVPNPDGVDANGKEEIRIKNGHVDSVSLNGWRLRRRNASTFIALSGEILGRSELVIPSSNKLVNSGETYDLYNNSGDLIDTVTYPAVEAGEVLTRDGYVWQSNKTAQLGTSTEIVSPELADVVGRVTRPRGRTIDLVTSKGEATHVVVHTSYVSSRPKLHVGDTIHVTGRWKQSRSGLYVSVRIGDIFELLELATPTRKRQPSIFKKTSNRSVEESMPPPRVSTDSLNGVPRFSPAMLFTSSVFTSWDTPPLGTHVTRFWLVTLFSLGIVLVLPFSRPIPV